VVADQVALQKCPVIIIIIVGIATDTIMLLAHNKQLLLVIISIRIGHQILNSPFSIVT